MERNRLYKQHCLLAQALNVIGNRWALLIVRELLPGPQRFSDLRGHLPGLSPNVLTQRLADLQSSGIVEKKQLPSPASVVAYALTRRGRGLRRSLESLVRWGRSERMDPGVGTTSLASVMLLLEASFDPDQAKGPPLLLRLTLGEEHLGVEVRDGCLNLWRASTEEPLNGAASLFGAASRVTDLILGRRTLGEALGAGDVRIEGERSEVERFLARLKPRDAA